MVDFGMTGVLRRFFARSLVDHGLRLDQDRVTAIQRAKILLIQDSGNAPGFGKQYAVVVRGPAWFAAKVDGAAMILAQQDKRGQRVGKLCQWTFHQAAGHAGVLERGQRNGGRKHPPAWKS